jgi:hypothetical protein
LRQFTFCSINAHRATHQRAILPAPPDPRPGPHARRPDWLAPRGPEAGQAVRHAWLWLARLVKRLNAFADSYKAGTLKPPRPRTTSQTGTEAESKPEDRKVRPKPAPSGWLALVFAAPDSLVESIATLMAEHDIRLILGQEPTRFGRLLRPLARALGLPAPKPLLAPRQPPPNPGAPPPQPTDTPEPHGAPNPVFKIA